MSATRQARAEALGLPEAATRSDSEMLDALLELAERQRRDNRRLIAALDGLEEAVVFVDDDRIALKNVAADALLDLSEGSADHKLLRALTDPEELEDGELHNAEFRLGHKKIAAKVRPVGAGALIALRDITEVRRFEKVRRDFVANVSHELRTPLSIIRANAETLLDGALEHRPEALRFTDAILRHSERLSRLVSDLLDLSRLESGRFTLNIRRLDLHSYGRRCIEALTDTARRAGSELALEIPEGLEARADARALEQCLLNLTDNAVKYTPPDTRIVLRAVARDDEVLVEVEDDGPGLQAKHRTRLFERFYRVDKGRSRSEGGTGLGLAIVKHSVEAMGGQVGMRPREPHGSVFWFTLSPPLRRHDQGDGGTVERDPLDG